MSHWNIKLWRTYDNHSYCEDQYGDGKIALKRAKTYIEGAFDEIDGEYVDVDINTSPVTGSPTEKCQESFTTDHPCGYYDRVHFDSLLKYFQEWLGCNDSEADHCNMLLTNGNNHPGGGWSLVKGKYGTVASGYFLPELPSNYVKYQSKNDAYQAMAATLHEIGHNIMKGGDNHHQRGATFSTRSGKVNTPMGPVSGSTNECDDPHDGSQSNVAMHWSTCSEDAITK